MKIEIITIGDEILIGQIVDTNSAWMAQELNRIGGDIIRITTVGDVVSDVRSAIDAAMSRSNIVLITGGLGPTKDDMTKNILCDYFDSRLIFDKDVKQNIDDLFAKRGIAMNILTENQALVPDKSRVIMNRVGTAPCLWFEKEGKILVAMPGVPLEMKWLMSQEIIPRLENLFRENGTILHHTCQVCDYSESALAEKLSAFETAMPASFKLAYLPKAGVIRLRLTGKGIEATLLEQQMKALIQELHHILGGAIFSDEDLPLAQIVGKRLSADNLSFSTAESCTGGAIASMITEIPGSSAYFNGGVVSYSNSVKSSVLGVSTQDLTDFGAVSEPVVRQMAIGVSRVCGSDCSVATSGIAGPDGGTADKPVGTVWIAAKYKEQVVTRLYHFGKSREFNIQRASNAALLLLIKLLNGDFGNNK